MVVAIKSKQIQFCSYNSSFQFYHPLCWGWSSSWTSSPHTL